jgi:predicted DNA-binding antitoxin AbrB/MazE fold protein
MIHAVFEHGIFRPKDPVELSEGCLVEFDPRIVRPASDNGDAVSRISRILGRRYDSGDQDVSQRHNEHQP